LAPPTATAFVHTAVLAPPKAADQDVTDAGQDDAPGEVRPPTPRDPGEGEARAEQASFAEAAAGTPGALLLLLYALSFVAAAASGFLAVWWWR
jgi:hypothetical protein